MKCVRLLCALGLFSPMAFSLVPQITVGVPTQSSWINLANQTSFKISGKCSEMGESIQVTGHGITATTPCMNRQWSFNLNLSGVPDLPRIRFNFSYPNLSPLPLAKLALRKDTSAPVVKLLSPQPLTYINEHNEESFEVIGSCTEHGQIVEYSGAVSGQLTCFGGRFQGVLSFKLAASGNLLFSVKQTDAAGNTSAQENRTFKKEISQNKVAVILLDYLQNGTAQSVSQINQGMFTAPASIKNFLAATSNGKINLTGDIYGWYLPTQPLYGVGYTNCYPSDTQILSELSPYIDFSNYDRYLFVINDVFKAECSAGNSTLGKMTIPTPQGAIYASVARSRQPFYFANDYSQTTQSTVAHEILHSIGIDSHAVAYLCGDEPLSAVIGKCTIGSYGDLFDMMGLRTQGSLLQGLLRERLGLFNPGDVEVAINDGDYVLNAQDTISPDPKLLKIPLEVPIQMTTLNGQNNLWIDTITIEWRTFTGFDYRPPFFRQIPLNFGGTFTLTNFDGFLVRAHDCRTNAACVSYLLDMNPDSLDEVYAPNEAVDAFLYPGQSFQIPSQPGAGLRVDAISVPSVGTGPAVLRVTGR